MTFTDSHAHLCAAQFQDTWQAVVERSRAAGVSSIINIGDNLEEGEWAIAQAEQTEGMYATAGIHPEYAKTLQPHFIEALRRILLSSSKVVALGEIGLDSTLELPANEQLHLFETQLQLATELELPVVLHVRDAPGQTWAWTQTLACLTKFSTLQAVYHCWTGSAKQLVEVITLGHYVSFSGILTYPNAGHILEAASSAPLDRILIETDAPYLIPEPKRREVRQAKQASSLCEPSYVTITAQKLADLRGQALPEIATATMRNTQTVFRLPR